MALAALISAYRHIGDGEALRATLPLVGGTLIEHQARQAIRAGATHVVILVERVPAALTSAIDALRRDGIAIHIARSVADAADRVHPDESLLVIADGCVATQNSVDKLVAASVPTLLTLPDERGRERFERIDGAARWAGMMLIDGSRLRGTIEMLGDWDLESTLLRRIVQEGAQRLSVFATGEDGGPAGLPIIAEGPEALASLEKHLVASSGPVAARWPGRYLFSRIEQPAAELLLKRVPEPELVAAFAALLALLSLPLAARQWFWAALVALLLSGPVTAIAQRLATVRITSIRRRKLFDLIRAVAAGGALLLYAGAAAGRDGWGWWVIAGAVISLMLMLKVEETMVERVTGRSGPTWLASLDGLIWALFPFALLGAWDPGIAALAAYAGISFAFAQQLLFRNLSGGQGVQV